MCKKCTTPCYKGEYRSKIREIMKFSGIYLVKYGRLDVLYHYLKLRVLNIIFKFNGICSFTIVS
jgi:hypothetical protein